MAYNPRQQEFFVVYTAETSGQVATGARIAAASGNVLATTPIYANMGMNSYPEVVYNSVNDEYFIATWYITPTGGGDVWGHRVSTVGTPLGDKIPVEANPFFEGGDGIGLSYNPATNSYFVASQGPSGEAIGTEVSAAGVPSGVFRVTVLADGHQEIYQPQIASSPHRVAVPRRRERRLLANGGTGDRLGSGCSAAGAELPVLAQRQRHATCCRAASVGKVN